MSQLFSNIVTTTWALKHVLFVIDYKILTIHGDRKQRILYLLFKNTPQSVEQQLNEKGFIWFLKLSMKNSLLQINENVGKQSQNTQ